MVRVVARAKLNLMLRVGPLRDDGYHEIQSVMQTIDLTDGLEMSRARVTEVGFEWSGPGRWEGPERPDLVERVLGILNQTVGGTQAAQVRVVKRIPPGSGLGGGSADAAAAVLGMNRLMDDVLDEKQMLEVCAQGGSDVPFALLGGTAVASGRGEQVEPIQGIPTTWWVIAIPQLSMPTGEVYERFDQLGGGTVPGELEHLIEALQAADVERIGAFLSNDLERAAFSAAPLAPVKERVVEAGAVGAVMSGSGSAIAGLCGDKPHAAEVAGVVGRGFEGNVVVAASTERGAEITSD
ncbi:MAG: 4-(cytidine 5'-diphospho)-2-C-methyl-D-erythritol kinase [Actinomycetota bacterium]